MLPKLLKVFYKSYLIVTIDLWQPGVQAQQVTKMTYPVAKNRNWKADESVAAQTLQASQQMEKGLFKHFRLIFFEKGLQLWFLRLTSILIVLTVSLQEFTGGSL